VDRDYVVVPIMPRPLSSGSMGSWPGGTRVLGTNSVEPGELVVYRWDRFGMASRWDFPDRVTLKTKIEWEDDAGSEHWKNARFVGAPPP